MVVTPSRARPPPPPRDDTLPRSQTSTRLGLLDMVACMAHCTDHVSRKTWTAATPGPSCRAARAWRGPGDHCVPPSPPPAPGWPHLGICQGHTHRWQVSWCPQPPPASLQSAGEMEKPRDGGDPNDKGRWRTLQPGAQNQPPRRGTRSIPRPAEHPADHSLSPGCSLTSWTDRRTPLVLKKGGQSSGPRSLRLGTEGHLLACSAPFHSTEL